MKIHPRNKAQKFSLFMLAISAAILIGAPLSAPAQQWTTTGNDLSNANSGNVGIGTPNVLHGKLVVNKVIRIDDDSASPVGSAVLGAAPMLYLGTTSAGNALQFNSGGGLDLWQFNNAAWGRTLTFAKTGYLGIKNTSPVVPLDIVSNNVNYGGQLRLASADFSQITFYNSNNLSLSDVGRRGDIYYSFSNSQFIIENSNGGTYNGMLGLNPAGGNVGVGTYTPGFRLDVQGGQVNASGGLCIAGDCKTAWSQVGGTGGSSQWTTSGSSVYYGGNVGIGTGSPGARLDVGVGAAPRGSHSDLLVGAGGNNSQIELYGATKSVALSNDEGLGGFILYTNGPAFNPVFFASNSGNVGIGTTTPAKKLDVVGDLNASGTITAGNIAAKYQDVAEWVPASRALPPGTVVSLDPSKSNHVIASAEAYDTRVAGVVSEQPGITLGERGENKLLVATTGRVSVIVDAASGPIRVGDLLVTSDLEGVAMKSVPVKVGKRQMHLPGTLIGKALEPLAQGRGKILVLLSLQ